MNWLERKMNGTIRGWIKYYHWKWTHLRSVEKCSNCKWMRCADCENPKKCRTCGGNHWKREADTLFCKNCGYRFSIYGLVLDKGRIP